MCSLTPGPCHCDLTGETLLSPLVMCGPHGLKFQKPVELRLPHCASMTPDGWSFALKSSDSSSGMLPSLCPSCCGSLGCCFEIDWSGLTWGFESFHFHLCVGLISLSVVSRSKHLCTALIFSAKHPFSVELLFVLVCNFFSTCIY